MPCMVKRHFLHKQTGTFAHAPQTGLTQKSICHIKQSDKRDGSQNMLDIHTMSTRRAMDIMSALTSSWSAAKLQKMKAHPDSAVVSMLLPATSVTAPKGSHGQCVIDLDREGDLDRRGTGRYEILSCIHTIKSSNRQKNEHLTSIQGQQYPGNCPITLEGTQCSYYFYHPVWTLCDVQQSSTIRSTVEPLVIIRQDSQWYGRDRKGFYVPFNPCSHNIGVHGLSLHTGSFLPRPPLT